MTEIVQLSGIQEEALSKEIFFKRKESAEFARENSVDDINFAPFDYAELTFADSLRSSRLNRFLRQPRHFNLFVAGNIGSRNDGHGCVVTG
jgi:hypothetical protein